MTEGAASGWFTQALARLRPWGQRAVLLARHSARRAGPVLRATWQVAKPVLRTALQVVLALLILLEEWGWRPLADLFGRLAQWRPWAQIETVIARLPPYAALIVFVLPSMLLLPLKFLALLLIAKGQVVWAGILFAAAKVVATALVARLFMLTQPALMQIGWFAWCYDRFMPWKDAITDYVRASWVWRVARFWKERAKRAAKKLEPVVRPLLIRLWVAAGEAARSLGALAARVGQDLKTRWVAWNHRTGS